MVYYVVIKWSVSFLQIPLHILHQINSSEGCVHPFAFFVTKNDISDFDKVLY
jgi:hypothetical protein